MRFQGSRELRGRFVLLLLLLEDFAFAMTEHSAPPGGVCRGACGAVVLAQCTMTPEISSLPLLSS